MSQGSGLVLLFHATGRARRRVRVVGVPQGRQRRVHPGARPRGAGVRRRDPAGGAGRPGHHPDGRATGVALADGTEFHADVVVSAPRTRAARSPSSSTRASCPTTSSTASVGYRYQGTSSKVNFALDGLPAYPALPRPRATCSAASPTSARRWSTSSGPSTRPSTAGTARAPTSTARSSRTIDPDMAPPGKHVMSCFVHYTPYELHGSDWDDRARAAWPTTCRRTLESFFPGFGDLVLQREVVTPLDIERSPGLPRATSSPASSSRRRCTSSVRRPAGVAVPHADRGLLPVRLRHAPGRLRDGRARQAGGASGSSRTKPGSVPPSHAAERTPRSQVRVRRAAGRRRGGRGARARRRRPRCSRRRRRPAPRPRASRWERAG